MTDNTPKSRSCIIVFAKMPVPGKVKTRLVPPLTFDESAQLYTAFLCDSISWFHRVLPHIETVVYVADEKDTEAMRELFVTRHALSESAASELRILPQRGQDLGERLQNAFVESFAAGFHRVVAVGSDQPFIPTEYLLEAFSALEQNDLTIGPAQDGGYYALGLKSPQPALFQDMPWSTSGLFAQTTLVARANQLSVCQLPLWHDVDDVDGLRWLIEQKGSTALGRNVPTVLDSLGDLTARVKEHEG